MPNAAAWKKSAKKWRKWCRREREARWREHEAMRRVGVSVRLAYGALEKGISRDYSIVHVDSTEGVER